MGQTGLINAKVHATKSRLNLSRYGILNSCFVAFRKVRVHLGSFRYCTRLGAKMGRTGLINAKVHATKSRLNLSRLGTLNSCFVAFHNVWLHLGPFYCCTRLGENEPICCN